ncbi:CCA tRNA nucleotidyltransferase [Sphingobium aromaticiconvertens]|uniref:CCA tRNA nucleotidyltransferase n=1 Tax=Sphingobium aromaticiconvertens TaxID=365341 RepID=UPI003019D379
MTTKRPDSHLPDAPWRHGPGMDSLFDALGARDGTARFVGGAVRDTLLGLPVQDVDVATTLTPQAVLDCLKTAGIKAVPTGIDHGTVTAIVAGAPVEITTLRRDVSTDGRRATVAYTDDWREDAARRDFTINALYADPLTGEIFDYFGGLADLSARRIRFIGSADARIAEDHLRIMRYFRFLARYGTGEQDEVAYRACIAGANSLMALSRERIADELMKLLAVTDPAPVLRLMIEGNILRAVLPEIDAAGVERVANLVTREASAAAPPSALRRLCALMPQDAALADNIATRLKLSNKARKRIAAALAPPTTAASPPASPQALAYRIGKEAAVDRCLLDPSADLSLIATLADWQRPTLGVGGGALIARGLPAGPDVATALRAVEDQWVEEGFPGPRRVSVIADQITSKFQRARQ